MSDFKAKMHKIQFPLGLCPRPRWGTLQRSPDCIPPDPLAVLKGPTYNGREGKGSGREMEGWREMEGKTRDKGGRPQIFLPRAAPGGCIAYPQTIAQVRRSMDCVCVSVPEDKFRT